MVATLSRRYISPQHAQKYYKSEQSQWNGKLARTLELSGQVQRPDFIHLANGRSPTGVTLIDKTRTQQQQQNAKANGKSSPTERAGFDLTTSPPKSVSIEICVFGNRAIEDAHHRANATMLRVLEERYPLTRITQDGKRPRVFTTALLIASFSENTSRSQDPQFHTHNFIFNLQINPSTQRWQSLENSEIYKAKMLLGLIYRNELAFAVRQLGYAIQITDPKSGLWELEASTAHQRRIFSERRSEITAQVGKDASAIAKEQACQKTRPTKIEEDVVTLERRWRDRAVQANITSAQPHTLISTSPATQQLNRIHLMRLLIEMLRNDPKAQRKDLERHLLIQSGRFSFDAIQSAIDQFEHEREVHQHRTTLSLGAANYAFSQTSGSSTPIVQSPAIKSTTGCDFCAPAAKPSSIPAIESGGREESRSNLDHQGRSHRSTTKIGTNDPTNHPSDQQFRNDFTTSRDSRADSLSSTNGNPAAAQGIDRQSTGRSQRNDRTEATPRYNALEDNPSWQQLKADLRHMDECFTQSRSVAELQIDSSCTQPTVQSPDRKIDSTPSTTIQMESPNSAMER